MFQIIKCILFIEGHKMYHVVDIPVWQFKYLYVSRSGTLSNLPNLNWYLNNILIYLHLTVIFIKHYIFLHVMWFWYYATWFGEFTHFGYSFLISYTLYYVCVCFDI